MAQIAILTFVVIISSGFMNNVGALALLMPVAIWMSRRIRKSYLKSITISWAMKLTERIVTLSIFLGGKSLI